MGLSAQTLTRANRRRRRALALTAIAIAIAAGVAAFTLGNTGGGALGINPLPGATNGEVANITSMSSNVTRSNGGASLQTGVALARVAVAEEAANHLKLNVSWTNAQEGGQVLSNPHAQISVGLYHPIHTGECTGETEKAATKGKEVEAPYVNITDEEGAKQKLCGALTSAGGSGSVSSAGKLLLATNLIGGYLAPSLQGKASLPACGASTVEWCQPESVTEVNQDVFYLVASIVTPGGIPQGQQEQLGSLKFFVNAKRLQ